MTTNKPKVKRFNILTYQGAIQSQGAMCVLASDYDALQAECEKLHKDAERYRWLRDRGFGFAHDDANQGICVSRWGVWPFDTSEGFSFWADAAIDAAMEGTQS